MSKISFRYEIRYLFLICNASILIDTRSDIISFECPVRATNFNGGYDSGR